jgi:EAL domain-containing protein (putative c-di-GMP-specific phosphodiesterase class I)
MSLAQNMGLVAIAQGVETEGQRAFLAGQGCDAFQGTLFGRPMSADEFELFLTLDAGPPLRATYG